MQKYRFPALTEILKVKVGTKYVWEERVRQQAILVHMLEDVYGIKINMRAFSFYPNYLYFGMPITAHPDIENAKGLWRKVVEVWTRNRWKVYAAFEHVNPRVVVPENYDSFEDMGFDHVQLLLAELVVMDLNYPSHGVGEQLAWSLFQPMVGFARGEVSRMVAGRPGSVILRYESEEQLMNMLNEVAKRKSYQQEPFYVKKAKFRLLKSVFKGKKCLNEI